MSVCGESSGKSRLAHRSYTGHFHFAEKEVCPHQKGRTVRNWKKKSLILCFCPEVILVLGDSIIYFWACNTKINSEVRLNAVRCPLSCYCYRKHSRKFHPKKKKKKQWKRILTWMKTSLNKHKSYQCAREYLLRKKTKWCLSGAPVYVSKAAFFSGFADCKTQKEKASMRKHGAMQRQIWSWLMVLVLI